MAILLTIRFWVLAVALSCFSVLYGNLGMQQRNTNFFHYIYICVCVCDFHFQSIELLHQSLTGRADEQVPQTGGVEYDPAEITAKALLCFNNKYVSNTLSCDTHSY
jgi:hypothetical protein